MLKKEKLDDYVNLPAPDDSAEFFQTIKQISEKLWAKVRLNKRIYGYQIQMNTKWRAGLSDAAISDFENELQVAFPPCLKNLYRTMNGLDKPGINIYGNDGTEPTYFPVYYSFPDDLKIIKDRIQWVIKENGLTFDKIVAQNVPKIFPVTGHRFLILDGNDHVLSMYGNDIIYWSDNLSKLIATDIFDDIENEDEFESNPANARRVKFWLD